MEEKIVDGIVKKWSLEEDLKLINAISNCGYGSWDSIALEVPPYSPEECEQRYNDRFLCNSTRTSGLCSNNCGIQIEPPETEQYFNCSSISRMNEYIRNMGKNEPNSIQGSNTSIKSNSNKFFNYMATLTNIGYNRVRSDFDTEYDNNAEYILKMIGANQLENVEMAEEESRIFEELEMILYKSYNDRLKQRYFRKRVLRDHCLIDRRKTFNMYQRLDVAFGRTTLKSLMPLMRFLKGPEFDYLIEKLKYQNELRLKIALLIEYRNNGLKFLSDIDIYKKLQNKRYKYMAELGRLDIPTSGSKSSAAIYNKKPSAPLALGHLPGYNHLNEDEKKLCSTYRIVPETYNSFKEVLVAECEKHDGLRLAQARNLIKIDVNKTRKIYDYLISLNLIWQPDS